MNCPTLYSFRRCPYAMRARMALNYAGIAVDIIEISLKNKSAQLLRASPKGTVPVLVLIDGTVLDESLPIMRWALANNDPDGWLTRDAKELIAENDNAFKKALDRYKYATRFPEKSATAHRVDGEIFLFKLESLLNQNNFLSGDKIGFADIAIFPFIRQFVGVDTLWFEAAAYIKLRAWLKICVSSALFLSVMLPSTGHYK